MSAATTFRACALSLLSSLAAMGPVACTQDEELDADATRNRLEQQAGDTTEVRTQSALVGTAPSRTRTISAMMFDISAGPPVLATITNLISGPGRSQRHMYQEISYGLQDLVTDYQGPFTLPVANCLTIACCGPSSDRTGNGATVAAEIAALPKVYDHYFWVYGKIPAGANCGTWGDEGRPNRPAVYSNYSFGSLVGYAQEIGHNFGMTHEPTMTCAGNVPFLDDPTQCTHVEYGNQLSFMGGGEHHPSAYHKFAQGWIGKCNVVKAGASGTFTLVPQELPCDGVQLLQVAAPKVRAAPAAGDRQGTAPMLSNYYLEMRGPYGFDSNLPPMVLVSIGGALPTAAASAPYLYLLDLTPEAGRANLNNAGLMTVGQSFSDPAGGLTFTLMAIDARSATVSVTTTAGTGGATCSDATPFTLPGPGATSCGPLAGGGADGGTTGLGGAAGGGAGGRAGGTGGSSGAGGRGAGGSVGAAGSTGTTTGLGGANGAAGGRTGGGTSVGGASGGTDSGTGGTSGGGNQVAGGCSCAASSSSGTSARRLDLGLFLLMAVGLVVARRRSRRQCD